MSLFQTNEVDNELIYDNVDHLFESDKEDEGLIGNFNINVLSKYIALYSQSPSNFFSVKKNYKQYGNEKNTNTKKCVISTENDVTNKYRNIYEYKTYEDSIHNQQIR